MEAVFPKGLQVSSLDKDFLRAFGGTEDETLMPSPW